MSSMSSAVHSSDTMQMFRSGRGSTECVAELSSGGHWVWLTRVGFVMSAMSRMMKPESHHAP